MKPRQAANDKLSLIKCALREKAGLAAGIDQIRAEREARVKQARNLELEARRLHRSIV
jgi:hypothetical protein